LAYARNLKFVTKVAHNNEVKIINKQWLLWLPVDVITKCEN